MDSIENLEIKLMYQEATIQELNSLVIEMQKELTLTNKKVEVLIKKIEELDDNKEIESRRPPHY